MQLARAFGADEVIDYTREDFADGTCRWDLILDTEGPVRWPSCGAPSPGGGRW